VLLFSMESSKVDKMKINHESLIQDI